MIRVLDPRCFPDHDGYAAPRLSSLQGVRLGMLWNNRPRGDVVLASVGEELKRQYGVHLTFLSKLRVGTGAPDEVISDLVARTDAVIVGVGD